MSKSDANRMEEAFGAVGVQELRKLEHMMDKNAKKMLNRLGMLSVSSQGQQMAGVHGVPWSGVRGTRHPGQSI